MSGSSVTVLCPNGRRVTVKITPNTSVLQILEDACKKQGFNPDEYNLKHLRRLLDNGLTVRHAAVPNRCQLEVVASKAPRSPAIVTVHIVTASGLRLVHDFSATATLQEILQHHESQLSGGEVLLPPTSCQQETVLVYAMRRISGLELHATSLRTLGLTHGKCMMRHLIQSTHSEGQAHVSNVLTKHSTEQQMQECEPKTHIEVVTLEAPSMMDSKPVPPLPCSSHQHAGSSQGSTKEEGMEGTETVSSSCSVTSDVVHSEADTSLPMFGECDSVIHPSGGGGGGSSTLGTSTASLDIEPAPSTHNVIKLGPHSAIIFSMNDAPSTHSFEEDDTFFELSVNEIKRLYMEQQKTVRELDEAPLRTGNMREMEESSRVLSAMNRYPVTHLRVYFPDQHVIQAVFKPTDTVATVIAALCPFLAYPTQQFHLYTRHPARNLGESETLVGAGCVPNARLYYGSSQCSPPYLSSDTLANKSSFSSACNTLAERKHSRGSGGRSICGVAGPSGVPASQPPQPQIDYPSRTLTQASGAIPKAPKWFKLVK